ncbi:UNVERIFIED_CONTAM: hypothetical protein K2H54_037215 [Gekko kuhli]
MPPLNPEPVLYHNLWQASQSFRFCHEHDKDPRTEITSLLFMVIRSFTKHRFSRWGERKEGKENKPTVPVNSNKCSFLMSHLILSPVQSQFHSRSRLHPLFQIFFDKGLATRTQTTKGLLLSDPRITS